MVYSVSYIRGLVLISTKTRSRWVLKCALYLLSLFLFVMAALRSRCGHYIFALWFLLSSFYRATQLC